MYTVVDYKTKKELKQAVEAHDVPVYQPGGMFPTKAGSTCIEMPHGYHKAYASVTVVEKNGELVIPQGSKVK
jgi:hypothetical protein